MLQTFKDALNKGITPSLRRNRAIKQVIQQVIEGKPSFHSQLGSTVCTILHGLEEARVPYVLIAKPGSGYQIQVPIDEPKDDGPTAA